MAGSAILNSLTAGSAARSALLASQTHAVSSGIGLGVLPAHMVVGDRAVRALSEPLPALAASVWVLTHPELRQVARIRALMQWLADDPPLAAGV